MDWMIKLLILLLALVIAKVFVYKLFFKEEIQAALERDPASRGALSVILTYPGLHALFYHRVSHALYQSKLYFLSRVLSQFARSLTGVEIHPGAVIGKGLFIDHGMGVVIGETAILGENVTLFQGVTLGGTGKETGKRHPTLGTNVVVGTGAKVLGNITIGDNSYIGANAVVIKDVPTNATVVGVPGRITRQDGKKIDVSMDHIHVLDPMMQQIDELNKKIAHLEEKLKGK